jgi:hypothetical protein
LILAFILALESLHNSSIASGSNHAKTLIYPSLMFWLLGGNFRNRNLHYKSS